MAFGESKMKGAPNGHLMWRVGGGEGGTVGSERWSCDAAQLREMTEEQRKLKSKLRTKKQRQRRRANSMQTHGKRVRGWGDKGQREVAECQAYADGEMLALLKAIKWNYNLIVINNSEDSLSGVEKLSARLRVSDSAERNQSDPQIPRNVCMLTHSPYPSLFAPCPRLWPSFTPCPASLVARKA